LGRKAVWTGVAAGIAGIGWTGLMIGGQVTADLPSVALFFNLALYGTVAAVFFNLALYGTVAFAFGAIGLVFELPLRMRVATLLGVTIAFVVVGDGASVFMLRQVGWSVAEAALSDVVILVAGAAVIVHLVRRRGAQP
jgi:hypothetical protein